MALGSAYVHYILLLSFVIYFIVVFCIYRQNPVSFAFKSVSFVFNVWRAAIVVLSSPSHYWLLSMHVHCNVLLLFVIEYVLLLCIHQQIRVSFLFKRVSSVNRLVLWASTELDVGCRIQNLQPPSVHYPGQPSFDDYLRNLEQLTSSWVRFGLFIAVLFPDNLMFLG